MAGAVPGAVPAQSLLSPRSPAGKRGGFLPGKVLPRAGTRPPTWPFIAFTMDGMSPAPVPGELGAFLKARRAQLSPREVGLPEAGTRRKVAGLRREEVAQLAAISVDYYTRLEQGRVQASASVLATLARALRLDEDQQAYLYEIAGKTDAAPRRRRAPQRVRPAMRRLLDQLTQTPAIVLGRRMDILAWNPMAAALYTDFAQVPARPPQLRAAAVHRPRRPRHAPANGSTTPATPSPPCAWRPPKTRADPGLAQLVGELSVQDPDFRAWWAEHHVNSASYGTKHYRHRTVGDLTLDCDTWDSPDGSGQRLMVLTAEPGTPSHDALRILVSWTATETERPDPAQQKDMNR